MTLPLFTRHIFTTVRPPVNDAGKPVKIGYTEKA
jgi:hypothetical protein